MSQDARNFRAVLLATALAGGLMVVGAYRPVHSQPAAVIVLVENPWNLVDKQTLPLAIAAVEKSSGGRVLEIRFRVLRGAPGFDAVVAKSGAFSHLRIAIPSNTVAEISEVDIPDWMANWVLKADAGSLAQAKLHLVDAVEKAEQITDGAAVDAGVAAPLTADNRVLAYDVEVIKSEKPVRLAIDASTGDPIANPDALLASWTPEKALYESLKKQVQPGG
jgi:hypothetical protein